MKSEVPQKYLETEEGRRKIAAHMIVPVRCGGGTYIDGKLHLRIEGWLVPSEVLKHSRLAHNGDPWPGIREYQATHEPYTRGA